MTTIYSAASKNLIYVGPVNQMIKRMKKFSIGSSLTSTALAPSLIYFSADHWSLFAKVGLLSSGLPSDHLIFEKLSFWGRKRIFSVPLNDLFSGEGSIFNTWKSRKTGEGFLIQFIPPEETTNLNRNVSSYQGERVNLDEMSKIYNEIAVRR